MKSSGVKKSSMVDSRDVKMHYLYKRAERNGNDETHSELMDEIQKRMNSDALFKNVFPHHAEMNDLVVVPNDFECLRKMMAIHDDHCGRFDDYSLKYVKHLVHTCETETPDMIDKYAQLIVNTCL